MRLFFRLLLFAAIAAVWVIGCSDKPTPPPPPVKIVDGMRYFPIEDGNTWYYSTEQGEITRRLSGYIIINGIECSNLIEGGETMEAWTLDESKFSQHLLLGFLWFSPSLDIPLNLEKDKPFQVSALGRILGGFISDTDSTRLQGTLTFKGYVTKEVGDVIVDSCIKLDYDISEKVYKKDGSESTVQSAYSEYYARGIGMIDNGEYFLDSAIVDGVKVP